MLDLPILLCPYDVHDREGNLGSQGHEYFNVSNQDFRDVRLIKMIN